MGETEKILQVRLLGSFSMQYGETKLWEGKKTTTKPFQLLQILLNAGNRGISRRRLLEMLFTPEAEGDVVNNLGVVVWQLRRLLQNSGLPQENYILARNGNYCFKASFPAEIDTLMMVRYCGRAKRLEGKQKIEMLDRACTLYGGHFLPELAGEEWADVEGAHYQKLYFETLEKLCRVLQGYGNYKKIIERCSFAAKLYPYNEWQAWQLKGLVALGKKREAMNLYREVKALYLEEPGEEMPECMRECFSRIESGFSRQEENISEIVERLQEEEKDGAYCCPYASFADSYHILERAVERSMNSVCLLLCTVEDRTGAPEENAEESERVAELLECAIKKSLRRGDIYTRYSRDQFLVMLPGISPKNLDIVIWRLDDLFCRKVGNPDIRVSYQKDFVLAEKL